MATNEHISSTSARKGAGFVLLASSSSVEDTRRIGSALGRVALPGTVVALQGDLGAGKTHFVQGVATGLGVTQDVTSPTFNLLTCYDQGRLPLFHFDLYRLEKPSELEDLGYYDVLDQGGLCCIEWSERFPETLPEDRLVVRITRDDSGERHVYVEPTGDNSHVVFDLWRKALVENSDEPADLSALSASSEGAKVRSGLDGMRALGVQGPSEGILASDEPDICGTGAASGGTGAYGVVGAAGNEARNEACDRDVAAFEDRAEVSGGTPKDLLGRDYVLALDTSNEIIALGLGKLDRAGKRIEFCRHRQVPAFRASNTKLIGCIEDLLVEEGIVRGQIASVVCGRGPGSFTGVRICLACAKGLAMGLGASLYGVSTLDAQAWQFWDEGYRGCLVVLGDAMRKEVYPVSYLLKDEGPERLNHDKVCKADVAAVELGQAGAERLVTGDALHKYCDLFASCGSLSPAEAWMPTGKGLLLCAQRLWDCDEFDPDDTMLGNPLTLLPVYTRLSDAEEHERQRFAKPAAKDLVSGVQGADGAMRPSSVVEGEGALLRCQPLDSSWVEDVAAMESVVMGTDAWNASQIADDLSRSDRSWWASFEVYQPDARMLTHENARLVGYAGGWVIDGQLQILKIASDPSMRRRGIARTLLSCLASDARDLGATEATLEVRASNEGAHAFYETLGMKKIGVRPRYYSDREDAFIFTGPLPHVQHDVAGMELLVNEAAAAQHVLAGASAEGFDGASSVGSASKGCSSDICGPGVASAARNEGIAAEGEGSPSELPDTLILAIESSCDETAVALVDGNGVIISDVVASQIDFHSRFGGVVPEIASRKHIEAIGGVVQECMAQARIALGLPNLGFSDLSAIGVTYAPGLLGALVVGVAYAKGLAWSAGLPLVAVNHLEGHLYANKIARPDIKPPMVVSLVSGGHTMLVHVRDWGSYEILGSTLDDAVGEAFDKVAKAMGLGYPGGPLITKLAETGDPRAIRFPRAMMHSGDYAFSLSGLKTAVMTHLQKEQKAGHEVNKHDVSASFQAAVVDVQVSKARNALRQTGAREFCLGGGVAANPVLRAAYEAMCAEEGVRLTMPPMKACTDNASMIALVALERYREGKFMPMDADARAHVSLEEPY